MKVADVLADLGKRFPRSPIEAWAQTYLDALDGIDSHDLDTAYRATMREWAENFPPRPAHILASIRSLPKPSNENHDKRRPWEIAADKVRDRARDLLAMAKREVDCGPLDSHMHLHLWNVASRVARMEAAGKSIGDALAYINGREIRAGYPKRPPDLWADDIDREIFAKRLRSQARVMEGYNADRMLERGPTRRAEITARIPMKRSA